MVVSTFDDFENKKNPIMVVGLGYVGLPLALLLAKKFSVIGFDIDAQKIKEFSNHFDRTGEIASKEFEGCNISFTDDPASIRNARFIIIAVPTPIDENNTPDLRILEKATEMVGKYLQQGTVVVYESTVYPGVTEDICVPILERESSLTCGVDFKIGYSPERVNPGDKDHTIATVVKVVSGMDKETLQLVSSVYGSITKVYEAASIKVAEAAKAIENTQRDLNIALINELAMLFHKMDISIYDVLAAAETKWNFLPFKPGLVGGHCIGVDPYYLTYCAQAVGHHPEAILAGRKINDNMHKFIAHEIVKEMAHMGKDIQTSTFVVLGITFKENVADVRNSKVAALCKELQAFGVTPVVYDPLANPEDVMHEYGIHLIKKEDIPKADTLIIAVAHEEFKRMNATTIRSLMNDDKLLFVDIKHLFSEEEIKQQGINYWSL